MKIVQLALGSKGQSWIWPQMSREEQRSSPQAVRWHGLAQVPLQKWKPAPVICHICPQIPPHLWPKTQAEEVSCYIYSN